MARPSCLIVGAGVLGLFTARALLRMGYDVQVLEARQAGAGASGRSGALVRSSLETSQEVALAQASLVEFREMSKQHPRAFSQVGCLTLLPGTRWGYHCETAILNQTQCRGMEINEIAFGMVKALLPSMRTDNVGAVLWQPSAGHCDAGVILNALVAEITARGGKISTGVCVTGLRWHGSGVCGVRSDAGEFMADHVVIAAGAWALELLDDFDLPAMHTHLSRVALFRPIEFDIETLPTIIDHSLGAWFRSFPDGRILVGLEEGGVAGVDPQNIPMGVPEELLHRYQTLLAERFDVSRFSAPAGAWSGAFMMSEDGLPVIGAIPGCPGLFVAAADNGGAFKMAPALGTALADIVDGQDGARFDVALMAPVRSMSPPNLRPLHSVSK